jgi:hypothetical protein
VTSTKKFSLGCKANIILIATPDKNIKNDMDNMLTTRLLLIRLKAIDSKSGVNIKIYGSDSIALFVIFMGYYVVDNENSVQYV